MVKVALFVTLEAKQGKEAEVAEFLRDALPFVQEELNTIHWFALKINPSTFAIYDTFPDEPSRKAHLVGKVASKLMEVTPTLLAEPPQIEFIEVLAQK